MILGEDSSKSGIFFWVPGSTRPWALCNVFFFICDPVWEWTGQQLRMKHGVWDSAL